MTSPAAIRRERASSDDGVRAALLIIAALMAPLLAGWGVGLGRDLGTAASLGVAAAAWLVALALAVVLDRAGRRGPAELLLRRITHGPRRAPTPAR